MRANFSLKSVRSFPSAAMLLFLAILPIASSAWAAGSPPNAEPPSAIAIKAEMSFMTKMIDHHAVAVEMAVMCQAKAEHDELIALCGEMKETQLEEIDRLQDWLDDWYDIQHEPVIKRIDRFKLFRLNRRTGSEFEIAFMEQMSMHHRGAILMIMDYYPKIYHAPLAYLMENMLMAQILEIRKMQAWLCEWYGLCTDE